MNRVALLAICLLLSAPVAAQSKRPAPKTTPAPAKSTAAAAPKTAAPKKEMAVPFKAGEVLEFDVGWSSYLTAGNATVSVQEKKPSFNSVAYYIVAEGRPTPLLSKLYTLYYKADTLLDVYSLLPQRGSLYVRRGQAAPHEDDDVQSGGEDGEIRSADRHARGEHADASGVHAGCAVGALRAALDPDEGGRQVQHAGHRRG